MTDEPVSAPNDDYDLLSTDDFDNELDALDAALITEDENRDEIADEDAIVDDADLEAADDDFATETGEANIVESEEESGEDDRADELEPETLADDERLRGPRAQRFRRRRQNRIAFLPLALYLIGLGGYLIAREQNIDDLPDFSSLVIGCASILIAAFTMIFHALLSGRRERGLLLFGLWIGATAGLIAALVYFVDDQPDAVEWWPLVVGALGLTFFVGYIIERTHDIRLLWLMILSLTAAGIAYVFTSDTIDEEAFSQIADYWPLLLSVIGIGIMPLVFRRHLE
ncbi:MAG: hypothetical protein JXA10_19330 [Anaerolineae bacterium]|nr:hypothetical protein [Anaerolineae bacterium]